ncbi:hypothetical protein QE405_000029 [Nocardioides zeae]|uniref:Uncharacterized protein n=1 Tax=Nocardioides zeae TaxID=1457234 RepID=A0AAJ1TUY1_9ACTN|nr:hypothetical protein [Nocardioides zeae]MDQ1102745.1 hypothetical protein [Nocardioides zeae]
MRSGREPEVPYAVSSPCVSPVTGSTKTARVREVATSPASNITRVVAPSSGAGRTATSGRSGSTSRAAATWASSGRAGPRESVVSTSSYTTLSTCGVTA